MQGFVVEKNTVRVLAVCSQRLAVVSHHRDQRFVVKTVLADLIQQFADSGVGVGNFTVVRLRGEARLERRRRIVGIMRVVKMHPQKKGPVRQLAEPGQRMIDNHSTARRSTVW